MVWQYLANVNFDFEEIFREIARTRVYDLAVHTPLTSAKAVSTELSRPVFFKREDLQPTFSFKVRGAYNHIYWLRERVGQVKVICASAGNHGQGVALSAQKLEMPATVVMPKTTPPIKIEAVKKLGAEVFLAGDNYSEASEHCARMQAETGAHYIHPFADPLVIAGQGTVAREIWQDRPDTGCLFVPVGGGGLLAGICAFYAQVAPNVKIFAVEADESASYSAAIKAGRPVTLPKVGIFADGVAVKQVGDLNFQLTKEQISGTITVGTDEICSAIKDIYLDTRAIVEPSGALALAGLKKWAIGDGRDNKSVCVAINSGANMNFNRLGFVTERTETGRGNEILVAIRLPEEPGALHRLYTEAVGDANISEFNYRFGNPSEAWIFVGVNVGQSNKKEAFLRRLDNGGYTWHSLAENDLAKDHIRHMVGGRATILPGYIEVLFTFQFPERPGTLGDFLNKLGDKFSISLFHYRYFGADYGRVFIGFFVRPEDRAGLETILAGIGFGFTEVTDNPAVRLFL